MSYQAYLDNVKAKTGKTPEDFAGLATKKGLATHGDLVKWLKAEHSLGHGHATAIAGAVLRMGQPKESREDKLRTLFAGKKQQWLAPCDSLIEKVRGLGPDIGVAVGKTYLSLLRRGKKFAILQPSSAERLDIGIKLKGVPVSTRFEAAGSWNAMVTHRARIDNAKQMDGELLTWLTRAYESAA